MLLLIATARSRRRRFATGGKKAVARISRRSAATANGALCSGKRQTGRIMKASSQRMSPTALLRHFFQRFSFFLPASHWPAQL